MNGDGDGDANTDDPVRGKKRGGKKKKKRKKEGEKLLFRKKSQDYTIGPPR